MEASDSLKVVFEASPNQKFGFDAKKYTAWTNNYELIKLAGGKTYFVPYKSIGENQNDEVYANVTAFNFDAQKLSFKTVGGQTCTAVNVQGKLYKVTVPHTANAVYAWYNSKKIGKLSVISLPAITRKLVIVPVNNATVNSQTLNNQALNTIFRQANVSWSVSIKSSFSYSLNPNGLQAADAGLMSKYSQEMRALRDAYRNADTAYDKQAYYVFVVNNFSDPTIKGYMVRGRALGFVASSATVKDIAHELAHGAFGLEHTFPSIAKSSSDNLLDYKQGTELSKAQWDEMQKSGPIFNWFDDEEDAAMAAEDLIKWLKRFFDVNCINNYKNYDGVIPECAWNNMLLDAMPDKGKGCAMVCGLLDGAFITIKDAINITALVDCWSPLNPNSSSQYCEDVKSKTLESIKTIREICGSSEGYRKIYNAIVKELDDWSVATFCTDRTCAYNQGKLLFDVLSVFYGGTEVKAALKSGVAGARIAQMMEEVDKTFKIISKTFTSLGKSITKTAACIQLCVKLNGNPNFVLATLDAAKKAIKFNNIELPASVQGDVIGKLDGINYIEGGIVKRGDIEIIEYEGSNGNKVAGWKSALKKVYKNVTYEDFAKTVTNATEQQLKTAYQLWGEEKWSELYNLFNPINGQKINGGWPPFNGFKSITQTLSGNQLSNKIFDRFQDYDELGGFFASPVGVGEGLSELVFTYDSRALKNSIKQGTRYIKFKFKNNLPTNLSFEYGETIPWFNLTGNADQIKSTINFLDLKEGIHYEIIEVFKYQNNNWLNIK